MKKLKSLLCFALVFVTILSAGFMLGGCNDNETPPTTPDTEDVTPTPDDNDTPTPDPDADLHNTPFENANFEIQFAEARGYNNLTKRVVVKIIITNKSSVAQTLNFTDFSIQRIGYSKKLPYEVSNFTVEANSTQTQDLTFHFNATNEGETITSTDKFDIFWAGHTLARCTATIFG